MLQQAHIHELDFLRNKEQQAQISLVLHLDHTHIQP